MGGKIYGYETVFPASCQRRPEKVALLLLEPMTS